jgi:hypothetical protein
VLRDWDQRDSRAVDTNPGVAMWTAANRENYSRKCRAS